ncbi:MAG: NAD(P)-dependent oxidoreductase [Actinomycetota bacterium]
MATAGDRPVIHVDKELSDADVAHVAGRADIVGTGDEELVGVAATVIGIGHFWDADRFARFPDLRVVSRMGIGYDNIDVAAARAAGVTVCNAPASPTVSTAEHTMALLLAVTKELPTLQQRARDGGWGNPNPTSLELDGAVLGLVGLGRIGSRVAAAAAALGMRVIGSDPFVGRCEHVELVDLDQVIETSDVISLHAPATDDTHHLVDAATIARMRRGVYLINCARGSLIDQVALLDALETGQVAGAGLDVTDPEPPDPRDLLLARDDVIVTPHIASSTVAGRRRLFAHAFDNALAVLEGRPATVVS